MATKLEEKFVKEHINGSSVFEFGCSPAKFTSEIAKDYTVTAIDLYDPEYTGGYKFIKGDIRDVEIAETFDTVVCLSSLEHCGIETINYLPGGKQEHHVIYPIANKLSSLVNDGGRLVITAPFGSPNIYYVDKNGNNGTSKEIEMPAWGFRTFRLTDIEDMFTSLELEVSETYGYVEGDYFEESSWMPASEMDYGLFNNKHRGLICCAFKKGNK